MEGLTAISASKIKAFKTCARQYYYRYIIDREDRPLEDKNVAALLGTALHSAIEKKYKEDASPLFTFQTVMADTLEKWEAEDKKINALGYYNTALKVGKQIIKEFDWTLYNPQHLEYAFTLPFPNAEQPIVMINGLIDMITYDGVVIDHKSASVAPTQVDLDNDAQFIIYAWAYEQLNGYAPRKVVWNHLRTAKPYIFDQTNLEDRIAQLSIDIRALLNEQEYPRINISDTCKKRCSYFNKCFHTTADILDIVEGE